MKSRSMWLTKGKQQGIMKQPRLSCSKKLSSTIYGVDQQTTRDIQPLQQVFSLKYQGDLKIKTFSFLCIAFTVLLFQNTYFEKAENET